MPHGPQSAKSVAGISSPTRAIVSRSPRNTCPPQTAAAALDYPKSPVRASDCEWLESLRADSPRFANLRTLTYSAQRPGSMGAWWIARSRDSRAYFPACEQRYQDECMVPPRWCSTWSLRGHKFDGEDNAFLFSQCNVCDSLELLLVSLPPSVVSNRITVIRGHPCACFE
jgi:hypothetical protein